MSEDDGSEIKNLLDEFDNDFNEDLFPSCDIKPDATYIECLRNNFGHKNFRTNQWQIISSIINEKRDNCAVMTTGYGKSLCYQFPSVFLETVTIVVSPLISLMEDQVLALQLLNIRACLLGTAQKDKAVLSKVMNLEYTLVYLTPEFITSEIGSKLLRTLAPSLSLIAIDEAHCISKWGHDFRKSFNNLGHIRKVVPEVPILAMTATATDKVRNDIITSLRLKNPQIVYTGFDRPNLEFNVRHKGNDVWNDIGGILQSERNGSVIVYCLTRNSAEEIASVIRSRGVTCEPYHAGMSINLRKDIHRRFVRDEIQIIVATIAFGMGIDKPDVRIIIHYGVCQDIESYYQEVGRAGRDGMPAKCFLFYSSKDFEFHKFMREKKENSKEIKMNLEKLSDKMYEFVTTTNCRRLFILQYFEDSRAKCLKNSKICCDNCKSNRNSNIKGAFMIKYQNLDENGYYDFTKDAEILLNAVEVFNGRTGLQIPILFLRGSKDKKIHQKYYSHSLYGAGKHKLQDWWKNLGDLLIMNKYIEKRIQNKGPKTPYISFTACVSQKSHSWLSNSEKPPLKLKLPQHMFHFLKPEKTEILNNLQINPLQNSTKSSLSKFEFQSKTNSTQELLKLLHQTRISLASQLDVMPYMIVSNKALHQLADKKPLNLDELKAYEIDGFSEIKIKEFGPHFIKCILKFENKLPSNKEEGNMKKSIKDCLNLNPLADSKITEINLKILDLWESGKDLRQISQIIGTAETTVANYMNNLMKCGYCITRNDLRRLGVTNSNFDIISSRLPSKIHEVVVENISRMCPSYITNNMIKYVVTYHRVRNHLKSLKINFTDTDATNNPAEKALVVSTNESIQKMLTQSEKTQTFLRSTTTTTNTEQDDCWGSDLEIDFEKIDADIEKANDSISSLKSNSIQIDSDDKKSEMILKMCDINKENFVSTSIHFGKYNEEIKEENIDLRLSPPKRRVSYNIIKNKIVYEDSSDDDDREKCKQDDSASNVKRRNVPVWLSSSSISVKRKQPKKAPMRKIFG